MTKRKDGRYQESISINGKRKYFYGKSPADVKKQMVEYRIAENKGKLFKDVADEWQENYKDIKHYTAECYKAPLKDVKAYFLKDYIKAITAEIANDFIKDYAKTGNAQQTVKLRLIVLRLILNYAVEKGYIQNNPAVSIKLPKNLKKSIRSLPDDKEMQKIKNMELGLLPYFMLYSGLRREEVLALTWDDIDIKNKVINVNKVVEFHQNKPVLRENTKTEKSERQVILLDILADKLTPQDGVIFKGKSGGYMLLSEFRDIWGGTKLTSHQMRHAYVTMLYEAGIDAETAMTQTGHANISTMRDIYTHIRKNKIQSASKKLNKYSKKF